MVMFAEVVPVIIRHVDCSRLHTAAGAMMSDSDILPGSDSPGAAQIGGGV